MSTEAERLISLDLLHTLSLQIEAGRGHVGELVNAGYTMHTAMELANLIDASAGRCVLKKAS